MRRTVAVVWIGFLAALLASPCVAGEMPSDSPGGFAYARGALIYSPDGRPLLLRGINIGNWLVPEGYMFKLDSATSPRLINNLFTELLGPDEARRFWRQFRNNYLTFEDIRFIKAVGLNSVRVPFSAKLFLPEEYDSLWTNEGFTYLDSVVTWCKRAHLWVVLDMHCAPGGQTGDNIDDSWGYPFLFEHARSQENTIGIWRRIAERYADEPAVLGYDLLNEPIAPYFDTAALNARLEPLYKRIVAAIRSVDRNHLVFLGGAQWNSNFSVFGPPFDSAAVYTFHRYWCDTTQALVQEFVDFRARVNVPIWLGESGENTDQWIDSFRRLLERNDIGWCFWPFKRMGAERCLVTFPPPATWSLVQSYDQLRGTSYGSVRIHRPDPDLVRRAFGDLLEAIRFASCVRNRGYIRALGCTDAN